jgi:hypothetical protein
MSWTDGQIRQSMHRMWTLDPEWRSIQELYHQMSNCLREVWLLLHKTMTPCCEGKLTNHQPIATVHPHPNTQVHLTDGQNHHHRSVIMISTTKDTSEANQNLLHVQKKEHCLEHHLLPTMYAIPQDHQPQLPIIIEGNGHERHCHRPRAGRIRKVYLKEKHHRTAESSHLFAILALQVHLYPSPR